MSYAISPFASRSRAFHGMGMGAYNPVAAPVFDGCTMNLTTGRTTWPSQWACNQSNFLAALDANKAMMPANASQTDINLHLKTFFDDVIAGKNPGPAGFPSKAASPAPVPAPVSPVSPMSPVSPVSPVLPATLLSSVNLAAPSSKVKYAIIGVGALAVVGFILAKRKRA